MAARSISRYKAGRDVRMRVLAPHLSQSARARRGETGAVLVETALTTILLLTIVFGVITMGLALYTYNVVAASAREATRFAMVRGADCTSWATACPASAADVRNYIEQNLDFPGINVSKLSVSTSWVAAPGAAACAANCNIPGNQVHVTVTYTFPLTIPFVSRNTLSLTSTSQMVISQ